MQEVTVKAVNRILTDSDDFLRQMQEEHRKSYNGRRHDEPGRYPNPAGRTAKKLIEKTTAFAGRFTVEFKPGLTIDIEA
ncbi:phage integrase family Site-specific recombinase [Bifidobacterium porcinum]|nr:phage integrase family Site-specific recombinase [Bifidobacterium porcinum]